MTNPKIENKGKSVNHQFDYFRASLEAERCLSCYDPPCRKSCPASIPIPDFIRSIRSGNIQYAAKLIREANPLAAVCGTVCPEEIFCQNRCTRKSIDEPIKIRELHSYATQFEVEYSMIEYPVESRIAIIGSGPAGLTCAIKLAEKGLGAVIFEQSDQPGGVPASSIPQFRLSDDVINSDLDYAKGLGVEFKLSAKIDNPQVLLNDYNAVFIATGLPQGRTVNIPGENLPEVMTALSFLEEARLGKCEFLKSKKVIIIGGGNVSLDVAAAAANEGASEVHLVYRRGPIEMKVWKSELEEAQNRGVIIDFLTSPVEYKAESGKLSSVTCIRTQLTEKLDSSGRRIPETIPGTEFSIPADLAITAIGLTSDYMKEIKVNSDLSTSVAGIFAGGDWARGEGTIVESVRDGKLAADSITTYVKDKQR
ncbi:MAG: FAD-dependent oxidoreductase [candidate division Zixibacteria bacterium]|nr:FAD-dependent oxidoreductase [candidate division Zixibacteria bacterium]